MYKYLIIAFLLSGCVTTPPPSNYVYSYVESTGSWVTREIKDELDGNWFQSYVLSEKESWLSSTPGIYVDTYASGRAAAYIVNGDGYICDTGTLKVRVKFDNGAVYSLDRFNSEFKVSENNERIVLYDNPYSSQFTRSDFLEKLAKSNRVIIETDDDCGTIKQINFNIEGNPHYIANKIPG